MGLPAWVSNSPASTRSCKEPRYQPTLEDYLVRYIKALVWWTMDRNACHVAVALGCFLYGYRPSDIASLAPELFNQRNIRLVERRLAEQLQARFQGARIFLDGRPTLCTRPPTTHDRQLVHHALTMYTPWGSPDVPPPSPNLSMLDTHFGWTSARSEWDRVQALIDPTHGGLPRLIREYNKSFPPESAGRLEDPDHALAIPCFHP
jgi:hypothetical protein